MVSVAFAFFFTVCTNVTNYYKCPKGGILTVESTINTRTKCLICTYCLKMCVHSEHHGFVFWFEITHSGQTCSENTVDLKVDF